MYLLFRDYWIVSPKWIHAWIAGTRLDTFNAVALELKRTRCVDIVRWRIIELLTAIHTIKASTKISQDCNRPKLKPMVIPVVFSRSDTIRPSRCCPVGDCYGHQLPCGEPRTGHRSGPVVYDKPTPVTKETTRKRCQGYTIYRHPNWRWSGDDNACTQQTVSHVLCCTSLFLTDTLMRLSR